MRRQRNLLAADAPAEVAVVSKAAARAATHLGLSNAVLAKVLGISEASVSRLRGGSFAPDADSKPFELAVLFVRLFRGLDAIVGGDEEAARSWLHSDNLALRAKPLSLIQTIPGLVQVVQYVDARRARI
jgi:hypothetical protein